MCTHLVKLRGTAVAVHNCIFVIIIVQDVEGIVRPGDTLMNSGELANRSGSCDVV